MKYAATGCAHRAEAAVNLLRSRDSDVRSMRNPRHLCEISLW